MFFLYDDESGIPGSQNRAMSLMPLDIRGQRLKIWAYDVHMLGRTYGAKPL